MRLDKITYSEFINQPNEWKIKNFSFGEINLIVGQNAVGKTRTLNVINGLAILLSRKGEIPFREGNYQVNFSDKKEDYEYRLKYKDKCVLREKLIINSVTYLDRKEDGKGEIFFKKENKFFDFQTPKNEVAAVARRDNLQHPYLEKIYRWADKCVKYLFGEKMGKDTLLIHSEIGEPISNINIKDTDKAVKFFLAGYKKYKEDFNKEIINDMNKLGYNIEDLNTKTPEKLSLMGKVPSEMLVSKIQELYVLESDLNGETYQHEMSQGMFRALSLLIQLNFLFLVEKPGTILIDDMGEGLDYKRSTQLIKILIDKAKKYKAQLIMTTNDQFVMNSVPIEHWFILKREGSRCYGYNYRTSKKMFDNFELTGLNNFDLLTTDFYLTGNTKNTER